MWTITSVSLFYPTVLFQILSSGPGSARYQSLRCLQRCLCLVNFHSLRGMSHMHNPLVTSYMHADYKSPLRNQPWRPAHSQGSAKMHPREGPKHRGQRSFTHAQMPQITTEVCLKMVYVSRDLEAHTCKVLCEGHGPTSRFQSLAGRFFFDYLWMEYSSSRFHLNTQECTHTHFTLLETVTRYFNSLVTL